ncbi:tumor necrosis factor alpha-induced protein 8-like isoform X2 [Ostrea edulis]|nr:tumor necrosis factor alpha-induced protein 8-like isoform X2 [Ostrea edulis]XP_048732643.1 tumor necrosis factor alpha-induced protein 8-like isoform X2 [Ostrea edulis]XP_048732645.1 tumor necrosis factor alpha-induced protein 8-like isoform X2 [Ostrea edulis]XP_048732646.1 tumor necrosis factor alpha-induced protein 8-like isoform X2 [Ostrea edulis]XP_048732648.1 tumor necrosis factor alpha-induced protein 8-like isoform X2 [Ostrea edulis]XP_056022914.1 tumor necrosis factor alpha-induced
MAEPGAGFDAKGFGLRAQKKLLGKMSSKKIVKHFIDDTTSEVLDNAFKIMKDFTGDKKQAEKLLKYLIKTIIKVGILYRNDQFNAEELQVAETFKSKFHSLAMTVVSFHEVEFTYEKPFLKSSIDECRQLLQSLIQRHLTDKSKGRADTVFNFFTKDELMDALFNPSGPHKKEMDSITADMHKMMDDGNL